MSDISAITTQSSATDGATALAGIKTGTGNLNTDKQEKGSGVTGNIVTFGSSNVLGDSGKVVPAGTIVGDTDTQNLTGKTYNKLTITTPASGSTLTIVNGKTLTASNTLTLAGTDGKGIDVGAATTGKLLVGNGTNMVLTANTFPNASATVGKVIKSDGTNWVASTETYAAPGTTGNVLTSDGTNWTSATASGGLGSWASATADGAGHQVTTDCFLVCYVPSGGSGANTTIFTDSASTPTTQRGQISSVSGSESTATIPIKKNDYYKIVKGGNAGLVSYIISSGS